MASRLLATSGRWSRQATAAVPRMPWKQQQGLAMSRNASSKTHADPSGDSPSGRLIGGHVPYMVSTYARPPPVFERGRGAYLYDREGRAYLDFTAGIAVVGLGHSDAAVAEIIADQAQTLLHASNLYYNPWTGALSRLLVEETRRTGGMHNAAASFIANSGSEANEAALKFARKVGKRRETSAAAADKPKTDFVAFRNAFHGRTMGALSATCNAKYQAPFAPLVPGFTYGDFNDASPERIAELVTPSTCGVIVEPIQGEGGVFAGTEAFLTALAHRCREVGALLIYDEIQCGMGRTGALWAHSQLPASAHPDILTTAKALGNGVPIGAVVVNDAVHDAIQIGDHGTTFGGNPLAARVGHHVLQRLTDPTLMANVEARSTQLRSALNALGQRFPDLVAGEVRGRGLLLGLPCQQDPTPIVQAARERGLLVITAGSNTLRFVPCLTVTEAEVDQGLKILEEAMEVVSG